jgi:hypothetical protein
MSNQRENRKAWMRAQRDHLATTGHRWRQAVSTGWESAGRGLRSFARVSGGFLTASWDGRYKRVDADVQSVGPVSSQQALRSVTTPVAAFAEGRLHHHPSANPVAFMRPNRFSAVTVVPPAQSVPIFETTINEQARKNTATMPLSSPAAPVSSQMKRATERQTDHQLAAQLEELFARKCEEFSTRLERRLDSFCEQTSVRLDALSEQAIRQFCDAMNQQTTEALNSLMSDWADQNRALVDAECRTALDRFAARLEKISSSRLEAHRKEIQNLSANLKLRLRGVAHALEDLGPVSYRS